MSNTKTRQVLEYLQAAGYAVGDLDAIEKKMRQQEKMVLLRFWADMHDDKPRANHWQSRLIDKWQTVQERLERGDPKPATSAPVDPF